MYVLCTPNRIKMFKCWQEYINCKIVRTKRVKRLLREILHTAAVVKLKHIVCIKQLVKVFNWIGWREFLRHLFNYTLFFWVS